MIRFVILLAVIVVGCSKPPATTGAKPVDPTPFPFSKMELVERLGYFEYKISAPESKGASTFVSETDTDVTLTFTESNGRLVKIVASSRNYGQKVKDKRVTGLLSIVWEMATEDSHGSEDMALLTDATMSHTPTVGNEGVRAYGYSNDITTVTLRQMPHKGVMFTFMANPTQGF